MRGFTRSWKIAAATALAVSVAAVQVTSAVAQSIVATGESFITSRLLPGYSVADNTRIAGLRMSMKPGWKTYWRTPGETGIPPRFDWSASENIEALKVHWPRPALFESFGMRTAGYGDVVVLPIELTPVDPDRPMRLALSAELGVCREICVLEHVEQVLEIAPDAQQIGKRQIRSALRRVPKVPQNAEVTVAACDLGRSGSDQMLSAVLQFSDMPEAPVVLVEHKDGAWIKRTKHRMGDSSLDLDIYFVQSKDRPWVDRSAFRMTVLTETAAYDLHGCKTG
ncbi:MAG: protein-disulfide reductase DsbD domain-containing protein [Paracoccaceae bacterium]